MGAQVENIVQKPGTLLRAAGNVTWRLAPGNARKMLEAQGNRTKGQFLAAELRCCTWVQL